VNLSSVLPSIHNFEPAHVQSASAMPEVMLNEFELQRQQL
jgi:hypothetical protein